MKALEKITTLFSLYKSEPFQDENLLQEKNLKKKGHPRIGIPFHFFKLTYKIRRVTMDEFSLF
tara:strand:- start:287 stop:475 length:189 start_codon:yes stop_codon:yes gene_type:complete